jgi:hypothetical protein
MLALNLIVLPFIEKVFVCGKNKYLKMLQLEWIEAQEGVRYLFTKKLYCPVLPKKNCFVP